MKTNCILGCLILTTSLASGSAASAREETAAVSPSSAGTATLGKPVFVQNVAPAAVDAVKVVDAFSAAIKAARVDDAAKLLDPQVLILESGGSERSRDEYPRQHAIADAAFMQSAEQQLRYRQAQAEGPVAWVGTESLLRVGKTGKTGKPVTMLSTETMVLKKIGPDWKIVHIHWSSRPAPKSQTE